MNIDGFYLKVNVNKKNMIDLEKLKKKKRVITHLQ